MKRLALHGTLLVTLLLAACGGGGDDRADTLDPQASASETMANEEEDSPPDSSTLAAALLSLDDMPPGWSVSPPDDEDDDTPICGKEDLTEALTPRAEAEIAFQQGEYGPFLGQGVAAYSSDDARRAMDYMKAMFSACTEFTETDDEGTTYTWRLTALSFPKVGDETFAARISASDIPFFGAIQVDLVAFRRGNVVSLLGMSAIGLAGTDIETLEGAVRAADAKLLELR